MANVTLGSISSGTLRTEDLLDAFAFELEYQIQRDEALYLTPSIRDALLKCVADAKEITDFDSDEAADMVNELIDQLNEYAPPYCYFGAHFGDGADFGFWPHWDAIDELPTVDNGDDAKALGEDCKAVNDHGNVTLYNMDGEVIWDCV